MNDHKKIRCSADSKFKKSDFLPKTLTDWSQVIFNGLLVLFSGLLWYSTFGQSKDMQASIRVAQISADAAQKNADILLGSERAQLSMVAAKITFEPTKDHKFRFVIGWTVENFGHTPGLIKKVPLEVYLGKPPEASDAYPTAQDLNQIFVAPQRTLDWQEFDDPKMESLTAQDVADLKANSVPLYIMGEIHYLDVFNVEHKSGFCYQIFFENGVSKVRMYPRAIFWQYT